MNNTSKYAQENVARFYAFDKGSDVFSKETINNSPKLVGHLPHGLIVFSSVEFYWKAMWHIFSMTPTIETAKPSWLCLHSVCCFCNFFYSSFMYM